MASGIKMFERQDRDKHGFVTDKDRELLEKEAKDGKAMISSRHKIVCLQFHWSHAGACQRGDA